ncbi:hypothetical protein TNCV_1691811 [Trichonephila clavipes]|nr:hypothetical protein TNCV_1691811 [Trichonephila clavipes]
MSMRCFSLPGHRILPSPIELEGDIIGLQLHYHLSSLLLYVWPSDNHRTCRDSGSSPNAPETSLCRWADSRSICRDSKSSR